MGDRPPPLPRKINDSVWEFCKPDDTTVEVIFFHGIQLRTENTQLQFSTWTRKGSTDDEYWPQTFFANDSFLTDDDVRVRALTTAYDASKLKTDTGGRLDLYLIAENFLQTVIENPRVKVGQTDNVPVVLVGHSFGGLLIKQLLLHAFTKARRSPAGSKVQRFLDNLAGVFFYSTPHLALRDEVFELLFPPGHQYSDLVALFKQLNKEAARLEEELKLSLRGRLSGKNWGGTKVREVFESKKTEVQVPDKRMIQIVEEGAARGAANETTVIDADHFDICRPEDQESASYEKLETFIAEICQKRKRSTGGSQEMDIDLPSVPTTRPTSK